MKFPHVVIYTCAYIKGEVIKILSDRIKLQWATESLNTLLEKLYTA